MHTLTIIYTVYHLYLLHHLLYSLSPSTNTEGLSEEEEKILLEKVGSYVSLRMEECQHSMEEYQY